MLVRAPLGELREVLDDAIGVGVEDVRPVPMDEDARVVVLVVRVAADMRAAVDDEDALTEDGCDSLGDDAAGEPRPDDDPVEPHSTRPRDAVGVATDVAPRELESVLRDRDPIDATEPRPPLVA